MTLLLELNDLSVRCFQDGQLLWQSAGVAVVDPALGQPLFGSAAWRESRKKPLHTYTQFWSQLNTDPLLGNHPQVRHHGDLAYLHLRHIESQLPFSFADQEAVFAVPAALSRESLSLLLGIANQCGLKTRSFVDSGLASMLKHGRAPTFTHAEMSLHHCVVTELQLSGNTVERSHSELLHDQGWFSLHTQLLNYFSDLFIRQTRFNPRHNAATEQLLFDAIPDWLRQSALLERDGVASFTCELNQDSVQVDIAPLRQFVQAVWQPLQNQLAQTTQLYLGDRLAQCMPLLTLPSHTLPVSVQQLTDNFGHTAQALSAQPAGVRFISRLPYQREVED